MTRRRALTADSVVDAAASIVETEGTRALTLSGVARQLGIKPPSLYNHVDGLDQLRRDVAMRAIEELTGKLTAAAMGRSGRQALHAIAAALRAYAVTHPGLYELSAQARPEDAEYAAASMRCVGPVIAVLRGYDLDTNEAIHAARALRAAIHGFVTLENNGGFGLDVDVDQSFAWLVEHLADTLDSSAAGGRVSEAAAR